MRTLYRVDIENSEKELKAEVFTHLFGDHGHEVDDHGDLLDCDNWILRGDRIYKTPWKPGDPAENALKDPTLEGQLDVVPNPELNELDSFWTADERTAKLAAELLNAGFAIAMYKFATMALEDASRQIDQTNTRLESLARSLGESDGEAGSTPR